jgi:hypothetical protein
MKLYIDRNLNINKMKSDLLAEFCLFCATELPISGKFKIHVVGDRKKHGIKTTASYLVGRNQCYIYAKNRALPDVMRSIAHEMTHMLQDEMKLINGPTRDVGGFHEDHANARAGELLKSFAKSKPYRSLIYESRKNRL